MAVKFKVSLIVDLDGPFRSSSIRIFGIKWSEDSRNAKSQNFMKEVPGHDLRSHEAMERSHSRSRGHPYFHRGRATWSQGIRIDLKES
jgi:hypothetical protein